MLALTVTMTLTLTSTPTPTPTLTLTLTLTLSPIRCVEAEMNARAALLRAERQKSRLVSTTSSSW